MFLSLINIFWASRILNMMPYAIHVLDAPHHCCAFVTTTKWRSVNWWRWAGKDLLPWPNYSSQLATMTQLL